MFIMIKLLLSLGVILQAALAFKVQRITRRGEMAIFRKHFSKYTKVFGVTIVADKKVPDSKLMHATALVA